MLGVDIPSLQVGEYDRCKFVNRLGEQCTCEWLGDDIRNKKCLCETLHPLYNVNMHMHSHEPTNPQLPLQLEIRRKSQDDLRQKLFWQMIDEEAAQKRREASRTAAMMAAAAVVRPAAAVRPSALSQFTDIHSDPDQDSDTGLKYLKYKMKYLQLKQKLGL